MRSRPQRRVPRAEREAQMLKAAAGLFATQGYHATSMDDVAAACGVTKPMVYSYFGSKDGLITALLERTGNRLLTVLAAQVGETDPAARLRATVRALIGELYAETANWQVVLTAVRGDGPVAEKARGYRSALIQLSLITLAELRVPPMPDAVARRIVGAYAYALLGAAEAGSEWWLRTPGVSREETIATALKVVDAFIDLCRKDLAVAAQNRRPGEGRDLPTEEAPSPS
ncbi:TetR/AcrR family transcriptional regulator [Zavarzinia compransoris]|uniref:TetR/AcrR family transcriptional regulator n=1 Tax=Zavarzinia marina TaxID=2911065 RepID=UPI001F4901C6|nr:TetR/AcrR family transcriptional regulator [Zavarzinia marina]MCF4167627.1 TetR/AcrR family transcriptional regulator [Zavarzinia marina]